MPNIIQGTCSWLLCFCISCLLSSLFANPMATSFSSGSSGRLGDFHSRCTILLTLSYTHTHTHTHTHTQCQIYTRTHGTDLHPGCHCGLTVRRLSVPSSSHRGDTVAMTTRTLSWWVGPEAGQKARDTGDNPE